MIFLPYLVLFYLPSRTTSRTISWVRNPLYTCRAKFFKRALWSGIYYRSNDAVFLSSGVIFDAWKIGLAYDINFSKLVPASNNRGSFEIALCYILRKKMKLESPIFICPDYL